MEVVAAVNSNIWRIHDKLRRIARDSTMSSAVITDAFEVLRRTGATMHRVREVAERIDSEVADRYGGANYVVFDHHRAKKDDPFIFAGDLLQRHKRALLRDRIIALRGIDHLNYEDDVARAIADIAADSPELLIDPSGLVAKALKRVVREVIDVDAGAVHQSEQLPRPQASAVPDCIVCMSAASTHALVPCGHMCVCGTCAAQFVDQRTPSACICPICRIPVRTLMRIYFP